MGGKRLAQFGETVRIDKCEHDYLTKQVCDKLSSYGIELQTIPHIRSKNSFGDIDFLCAKSYTHAYLPEDPEEISKELDYRDNDLATCLNAVAHTRKNIHNPTVSFLIEGRNGLVQIDITSIKDHLLDFAKAHLSWGDAGSISSAVARQMSLKVGMNGIQLADRTVESNSCYAEIPMSYHNALEMTGHDPEVHKNGFDTNEDIYAWIARGRYFDPKIWSLNWLTNKSRRRALKRPAYVSFLSWIETNKPRANYDWGSHRGEKTSEWFDKMASKFPDARTDILAQKAEAEKKTQTREFFSGKRVSEITGYTSKDLSILMEKIIKTLGNDAIERMAENNENELFEYEVRKIAERTT